MTNTGDGATSQRRLVLVHSFDNVPSAPRACRERVQTLLSGDGVLIASELVSNVVRHTSLGGTLRLWLGGSTADRIEVEDFEDGRVETVPPTDLGGRGLRIVDRLSIGWGVLRTPTGKVVWADLRG